jgi:arylsulfatase A-like enzyme
MPLLVRWPGVTKPGSINTDLVQNVDFAETFLEAAGVEAPADMQGRSLVRLLKGATPRDWPRSIYYQYYEFPGAHSVARHYGVRTARYKLIHFYHLDEWELYDLEKDPREMQNVYGDPAYAETVTAMTGELNRLREKYAVPDDPKRPAGKP